MFSSKPPTVRNTFVAFDRSPHTFPLVLNFNLTINVRPGQAAADGVDLLAFDGEEVVTEFSELLLRHRVRTGFRSACGLFAVLVY